MRLLFLSNAYPPPATGGYDLACQDVARGLVRRGHDVCVLTSRNGVLASVDDDHGVRVHRFLHLEVAGGLAQSAVRFFVHRRRFEHDNLEGLRQLVAAYRPDAALIWGMGNVSRWVPATVEELLPGRVVYYFCDYWPTVTGAYRQKFENPAARRVTALPKRLVAMPVLAALAREKVAPLRLERPMCVSPWVRDRLTQLGLPVDAAPVILNGIPMSNFPFKEHSRWCPTDRLRLLYAGRVIPEKGVHTAVRALAITHGHAVLDIVGPGEESYQRELRALVRELTLQERVTFREMVPRDEMAELLGRYDALVFPSEYQEPLGLMPIEAMACGLVVIGTVTGGADETLVDGVTALVFPPGDVPALAAQIDRLSTDPALGVRLARAGRRWVEEKYSLDTMVDGFEAVLQDICS